MPTSLRFLVIVSFAGTQVFCPVGVFVQPKGDTDGAEGGDTEGDFHADTMKEPDQTDGDTGDTPVSDIDSTELTCWVCHGSKNNPAPPRALNGASDTLSPSVGAHQAHLKSQDRPWHRQVLCDDCHLVPSHYADEGHIDSALPAELTWSATALADGASPEFNGRQCSNTYCHGATLQPGGLNTTPQWTQVDGSQVFCGTCHGLPPRGTHPQETQCSYCHSPVVDESLSFINPELHINGVVNGSFECGSCHAVPPQTGAHLKHYADTSEEPLVDYGDLRTAEEFPVSTSGYLFGCGNCHPVDAAKHRNGQVDVELFDASVPTGTIKSKNPVTANFNGQSCTNTYCHSNGADIPSYEVSPQWQTGTINNCTSCHDNPPRYASGGAGTDSANGHLMLADDGYEFGHFAGLPGPWHTSYHGGKGAAPITCQTCHYASVDPNNTGSGGFYYLDTTGDYDLGGDLNYSCDGCHTGLSGEPEIGQGMINPRAHVNGDKDVVFDPRTEIPSAVTGLPIAPNRPALPYWVSATPWWLPPDSVKNGGTWSFSLQNAQYDAPTKSCANIACHLRQSWGEISSSISDPLVWGETPVGSATCNNCHQY